MVLRHLAGKRITQQAVLFLLILLIFGVAACQRLPVTTPFPVESPEPTASSEAATLPLPEETPSTDTRETACAFVWANQNLPEAADVLRKALQEAGLPEDTEVRANAFGENCIDPTSGIVVRFLPMQTDFSLALPVASVDDAQEMGEWIEMILPIILQMPPGQVPGPNPGYMQIRFMGKSAESNLYFSLDHAQRLLREGLRGSALYRALESP